MYLVKVMPYEERLLNFMELFNEGSLLVCSYTLLVFTEYVEDPHMRSEIGWFYAFIVSLNFVINWLTLFYRLITVNLLTLFRKLRDKCRKSGQGAAKISD